MRKIILFNLQPIRLESISRRQHVEELTVSATVSPTNSKVHRERRLTNRPPISRWQRISIPAKSYWVAKGNKTIADAHFNRISNTKLTHFCLCRPRQRRPDRAVYVPRGRRSQTTPPTSTSPPSTNSPPAAQKDSQPSPPRTTNEQHASIQPAPATDTHHQSDNNTDHQQIAHTDQRSNQQYLISVEGESVKHNCDHLTNQLPAALNDTDFLLDPLATTTIPATNNTNMSSHKLNHRNQCNINSNDAVPETRTSDKDYNEDKEFQRASKVCLSCTKSMLFIFGLFRV